MSAQVLTHEVTDPAWLDFVTTFPRVYHTDPGPRPGDEGLLCIKKCTGFDERGVALAGELIAEVRYHFDNTKTYYIDPSAKP